ncbi:MAG: rRNA maturation RNase YbeY [Cytophagales bacterium]
MSKPKIHFFAESIDFKLAKKQKQREWLTKITENEGFAIDELNFIFTTDDYLLKINQDFLQHDTLTDIITFDNASQKDEIVGEIYISIERVIENAKAENVAFDLELKRVMAHGILHLCGYNDKSKSEIETMRKKENEALNLFTNA